MVIPKVIFHIEAYLSHPRERMNGNNFANSNPVTSHPRIAFNKSENEFGKSVSL